MTRVLIDLATLEQMVGALEINRVMSTDSDGNYTIEVTPKIIKEAITAGRAALAGAEMVKVELRGDKMLSAITVLLNIAAFGSNPLYEDGSETENRLLQLETARFLHSLHSDGVFEEEHDWLLSQVKLHPRYVEPKDIP